MAPLALKQSFAAVTSAGSVFRQNAALASLLARTRQCAATLSRPGPVSENDGPFTRGARRWYEVRGLQLPHRKPDAPGQNTSSSTGLKIVVENRSIYEGCAAN
uniref:Uncharacterized protein n=1 Tax=Chrysotila carterae TaxID=13221 RepID=A0A7S4BG78_CHRCT|eukprot:1752053-Pleurochrysis_carterae.AAC.1